MNSDVGAIPVLAAFLPPFLPVRHTQEDFLVTPIVNGPTLVGLSALLNVKSTLLVLSYSVLSKKFKNAHNYLTFRFLAPGCC